MQITELTKKSRGNKRTSEVRKSTKVRLKKIHYDNKTSGKRVKLKEMIIFQFERRDFNARLFYRSFIKNMVTSNIITVNN